MCQGRLTAFEGGGEKKMLRTAEYGDFSKSLGLACLQDTHRQRKKTPPQRSASLRQKEFKMVTRSKLRSALAAEKGVDFAKLKQQKKAKETAKRKALKAGSKDREDEDEGASDNEVEEDQEKVGIIFCPSSSISPLLKQSQMNLDAIYESDTSESSIELEKRLPRKAAAGQQKSKPVAAEQEEDEDEEEDEEEIPVSDLEDLEEDEKEDIVPHTRLTINNTSALLAALDRISMPTDKTVPFATHQSVVSSAQTIESIPDVSDDLQRELAFYSQCLEAVRVGRSRLISEGVPFSRPKDYFAEMVKEDAHMEKIKAKLVEEASAKKAAAEARKLRDLKKFGKQVQVSKLQERQKAKREVLDKIKTLKRSEYNILIYIPYPLVC